MSGPAVGGGPELAGYYGRAAAFFGERVIAVGDHEWDLPTPSTDWIVKAVVAHVVLGEAQMPDLIAGRAVERVSVDVSVLGPDPVSTWRGTALAALDAVARADLDQVVLHPLGPVPLGHVVGFRITENLVHGWDLAVACGHDVDLDPELAGWCLDFWRPMIDDLQSSDMFGPMLEPVDDRPGSCLLGLLGRRLARDPW